MGGEWQSTTWGELAELRYGKALANYRTGDTSSLARVYGTNGPIGWHDTALWDGPGVIIGRKGAFRGVHFADQPYWVIDTAYSLQPKVDINLKWAYYNLCSIDINNIDDGSPIPSTTRPAFYAIPVDVPPRGEQDAIVNLLAALDCKITSSRRIAETLEAMAHAVFRSWFIDFDPVRAKSEGRSTGLSDAVAALFPATFTDDGLPDGWQATPLPKFARFLNGLALQKYAPVAGEEPLPVIKIVELRTGVSPRSGQASSRIPEDYIINDGDHLFSWSGSLTHCRWTYGKGALNQHLFKVTPIGVPAWLTVEAVEHHMASFQAIASAKAVTMGHIQRHHLDEAMIALPDDLIMKAADDVIAPLHQRSFMCRMEISALTALRDTLLPKLISGELRIREAETRVAAA